MPDPRIEKLADLLVRYSLGVKKGDIAVIQAGLQGESLAREAYRRMVRKGAHVQVLTSFEGLGKIFVDEASKAQREFINPLTEHRFRTIDVALNIRASSNTRSMTNADPKKTAQISAAQEPLHKIFMDRSAAGDLRWALTEFPSTGAAQDAEMSLEEYAEIVFTAGHLDADDPVEVWRQISKAQRALTNRLNRAKEVRVVAEDTDLTFSCQGRKWINCDGKLNFPDGEVFTGPVEQSVNGHIRYTFPAVHGGREVTDVFLEFTDGKVTRAEAGKGEEFLRSMIAMDAGSAYLGEAAIGTNYNITRFMRNTLFDEKIGGTMHFALGAAYPETGSNNTSGLHWDMVLDLRRGGKIYVDDKLVQQDGVFLDQRFPQA
jgi:aminopeptidase